MPIDTALIGALHVEYLEEQGLSRDERSHHTLFQTSTIEALLDGNYEGDVTFAELGERGLWSRHLRRIGRRDDLPRRRLLQGEGRRARLRCGRGEQDPFRGR